MKIPETRINKVMVICYLSIFLTTILLTSAYAAQVKKIVVIVTMPVHTCEEHLKYFLSRLTELGYKNGDNIDLAVIRANGDKLFAESELRKIVQHGKPNAVVTIATLASQAALNVLEGTDVPIFFFQVSDPVGAGLILKIGEKTGTNITGRVFGVPNEVRVNMVMRLVGQVMERRPLRFGYIHSSYPSAMGDLKTLKHIQQQRNDIHFEEYFIEYKKVPDGVPEMLAGVESGMHVLSGKVDFWWQPLGPLGEIEEYTKLFHILPSTLIAMGNNLNSVKLGALMHITPNLKASGEEAADLVNTILKGAKPNDMPVTLPSIFDIGLNMTTALKLNIVVPPDMLELAGEHIYH
jgi:putative ABC transport system substrate-binding protein